jgi:hypothetical protein
MPLHLLDRLEYLDKLIFQNSTESPIQLARKLIYMNSNDQNVCISRPFT